TSNPEFIIGHYADNHFYQYQVVPGLGNKIKGTGTDTCLYSYQLIPLVVIVFELVAESFRVFCTYFY
ncbi:MAG: hypothetical protein LUD02_15260, partial [Tannerellaceae bacterium]|nr:hypothetical protein [Tannerellaceae bacterium]